MANVLRSEASEFDAVLVEMPQDDAELKVHRAHGLRAEVVPVGAAVDEVRVLEHWSAAEEHLRDLLACGADRSPSRTVDVVRARGRRDMAVAVAVQLAPAERVLVPHLEVDLGPT